MVKDYETKIDASVRDSSHGKEIEMIGSGKRVIDFGCYTGNMANVLKKRGCYVTGIEIDPEAAAVARENCDKVIVADLDEIDLPSALGDEKYDVGLFGDVIEHLKAPRRILGQTREVLAPGGYIVLSVPNIAHASIRLMMLKGEFNYEETGILDDTHLKYYTRRSIGDLLESCGYMVEMMDWVELRVPERQLRETLDPLKLANLEEVVKAFSTWEAVAYQYVVKSFPASEEEQVRRLSEEKVQAEHRLSVLEREVNNYEKVKADLKNKEQHIQSLEQQIKKLETDVENSREECEGKNKYLLELELKVNEQLEKKNAFIRQLEESVAGSMSALEEKDRLVAELGSRVEELTAQIPQRKKRH